jgi:hypothetical protein
LKNLKNSSSCPPGSLTLQQVVLPVAYSWLDDRVASPSALFINYSQTCSLLHFGSTLFAGVAILGTPLLHHPRPRCRFILWISHLFVLHRWTLILGPDGCNNSCVFFTSFSLDSSLPMRRRGQMYLILTTVTSNHGWLECTPHAIDVELDLPLADVDCSDGPEERSPYDELRMRLIFFRSWRWSFSWRFRRCSASAFRSCVARHLCLQSFSRPSTNICFLFGDVAVHLRLGLENINKMKKTKIKLGFSKTLY